MEHTEIRRRLSAYLEHAVGAAEREEIARHLDECASCRVALVKLELAVGRPKTIAGGGPPSWLAEKITAKQRTAGSEAGAWRRLSALRQVGFPVGALAVSLLCVAGYFLTADKERQEPPAHERAARLPAPASKPPERESAPSQPAPLFLPALPEMPAADAGQKRPAPPLPPLPAPALPGQTLAEPGLQPAEDAAPPERATETTDAWWGSAPAEPQAHKAEIVMGVADQAAAPAAIEQAVDRLGGTIVGRASGGKEHFIAARVEAPRLGELADRLGRIGTVRERPQLPAGAGGMVDLIIRW